MRANYFPPSWNFEDIEFRIVVEANRVDCFHHNVKKDHTLEVSYQVVESNSGSFGWLLSPSSASDMKIDFQNITTNQNKELVRNLTPIIEEFKGGEIANQLKFELKKACDRCIG